MYLISVDQQCRPLRIIIGEARVVFGLQLFRLPFILVEFVLFYTFVKLSSLCKVG